VKYQVRRHTRRYGNHRRKFELYFDVGTALDGRGGRGAVRGTAAAEALGAQPLVACDGGEPMAWTTNREQHQPAVIASRKSIKF